MNFPSSAFATIVLSLTCQSLSAGIFECCDMKTCGEQCGPSIVRPCQTNVYDYQRCCSTLASHCTSESACCIAEGCSPCCSVPSTPIPDCCAPPADCCTGDSCGEGCCSTSQQECFCTHQGACHCADVCREIDQLICQSKSAGYARERREAIHQLGDRYDCCNHPRIMNAFICALNDANERVRAKAADEIGDQVRRNRVRCGRPVICALQRSLGDHDRMVRRQAEQALRASGYNVVDSCCNTGYCPPVAINKAFESSKNDPVNTTDDQPESGPADAIPAPPATETDLMPQLASPVTDTNGSQKASVPKILSDAEIGSLRHVSFSTELQDLEFSTPTARLSDLIGAKPE